jgi:hypothetical protein
MPGFVPSEAPPADSSNDSNGFGLGGGGGGGGGTDDDLHLDPLLLALLKKIPDPEKGWPAAQRLRWFKTFAMNVSQIYDGDGDMDEPVEMKIELDKAAN